jgi:hypothetical protein
VSKRRQSVNPNRVKIHKPYLVAEIASLFDVSLATVRRWLRAGLKAIDATRPLLIRGEELKRFVRWWRSRHKRRCEPGEMYCLKCRAPRRPLNGEAELVPQNEICGQLRGACSVCGRSMSRLVAYRNLVAVQGSLVLTTRPARRRLSDSGFPDLDDHIGGAT